MNSKRVWKRICMIVLAVIFISSVGIAADKKAVTKPDEKKADVKIESKTELIDINTATRDQLKALEGIEHAYLENYSTEAI